MLCAVVVLDFPRREHHRHFAIGEIKIRILQRFLFFLEVVNVYVKLRQRAPLAYSPPFGELSIEL